MQKLLGIFLTIVLVTLTTPVGASASPPPRRWVTPSVFAKVMKVHRCEEPSSWHTNGALYRGGLGWRSATWASYRLASFPSNAAQATPQEQAYAMLRFVTLTLHYWPDQNYPEFCGRGY